MAHPTQDQPPQELTDAYMAYVAVWSSVQVAADVATARAVNPDACPSVPQVGYVEWLTRKALAQLMEYGLVPDGWETAYFGRPDEAA